MVHSICQNVNLVNMIGVIVAFVATCLCMKYGKDKLPTDRGKEFAHDGQAAKGKPQGAGLYFVLVFIVSGLLFAQFDLQNVLYLLVIGLSMITGFLDDAATMPWGRVKKGLLDLVLAIMIAAIYIYYNGSSIKFRILGDYTLTVPYIVMGILIVAVVWCSINVTNCADGVDGLSGTLSIITMATIYELYKMDATEGNVGYFVVLFIVCLIAYLWFNATPSVLMMGDAGSRAMGMMIAVAVIRTGSLFAYAVVAIVLILDGGLGLLKVSLIKAFKIHILKNIRTPLHDQVRKNMGWSNTHCVFRFAIIQLIINIVYIYLIGLF